MPVNEETRALLARAAREKTVTLITRGRRTGIPRRVTIWFVVDGDTIGLGTLNEDRNWVKNARGAGEVELELAAGRLAGRFADITDAGEHSIVRGLIAKKYWPARIASWFGIGQRHTFRISDLRLAA